MLLEAKAGEQKRFTFFFFGLNKHLAESSLFGIANELNLDFEDRLKFVQAEKEKLESFLLARLRFQKHVITEAEKLKDVYHLN